MAIKCPVNLEALLRALQLASKFTKGPTSSQFMAAWGGDKSTGLTVLSAKMGMAHCGLPFEDVMI